MQKQWHITFITYANMGFQDHANIIGTIAYPKSYRVAF